MKTDKIKNYIIELEGEYRRLKTRGCKTIDIDMIITDLMKIRL